VLRATAASIAALLFRHFLRWVLLANLIAWPVGYLAMRTWVRDFHTRAPIGIGLFVLAGAAAAALASRPSASRRPRRPGPTRPSDCEGNDRRIKGHLPWVHVPGPPHKALNKGQSPG
jgi:hypothetical protein